MKKLLSILFTLISFAAFAQSGSLKQSGYFTRVLDTATYQTAAATAHSQGYSDMYWNAQATTEHMDIWNGSSYTHVFDFNAGGGGGGGTVTSVSVTTANGVSGSVATATTTPAISLTLGAITPSSVNSVVLSGASTPTLAVTGTSTVSGTNTGDQTNISGNAATVTTNANLTGDVTSSGNATSIASGVIVDADVNASAAIAGTKIANTPAGTIAATTAQAAINELDTEKANEQVTHNIQTGSNYTLVLTDADTKSILMRALAAQTLTIPPVSSVAFPDGTMIILTQDSTGGLSVVAGSGVVIESSAGNLVSPGQDSPMVLEKKNASNSWFLRNGTPAITGAALTKVDDTNVTLTLGGTPSAALLAASSLTLGWTGDLAYSRLTQGSALSVLGVTGNATADVASIAAATDGHILRRSGTSVGFGKVLTNYITGTATNDAATAGDIGEEVNAIVSTYTNYATTATYQNITSITLTAGDWDLSAFFTYSSNSATITAASNAIFVISTTTASAAGATEGRNIGYVPQAALLGTSLFSEAIAPYRVSITGSTTYYLNSQATFTLGNPQYVGGLRARRVR